MRLSIVMLHRQISTTSTRPAAVPKATSLRLACEPTQPLPFYKQTKLEPRGRTGSNLFVSPLRQRSRLLHGSFSLSLFWPFQHVVTNCFCRGSAMWANGRKECAKACVRCRKAALASCTLTLCSILYMAVLRPTTMCCRGSASGTLDFHCADLRTTAVASSVLDICHNYCINKTQLSRTYAQEAEQAHERNDIRSVLSLPQPALQLDDSPANRPCCLSVCRIKEQP